jgi:hypothetical protein
MASFKASFKKKYLELFGDEDTAKLLTGFYTKRMAKKEGTIIAFGKGEERWGIIEKVRKDGVWIQEMKTSKELGFEPVGKPFYVKNERFRRHLGEFGAVSVEPIFTS